jgi:hypothetical protein
VSQYSNEDGVDFVAVKHRWRWKQKEKVEDEVADAIEKSCSLHGVVHVRSCASRGLTAYCCQGLGPDFEEGSNGEGMVVRLIGFEKPNGLMQY